MEPLDSITGQQVWWRWRVRLVPMH